MPWDRKRLLGYVETMKLILGVTDKLKYHILPRTPYKPSIVLLSPYSFNK